MPYRALVEDASSDSRRRVWLLRATCTLGAVGLCGASVPFVESFAPSEAAKASGAPVDVDVSPLAPGQLMTVAWRGLPVWLMRRTPQMIEALRRDDPALADPDSRRSNQPADCRNALRSARPDLFVAIAICTHLGCIPVLRLDDASLQHELHAPGGFYCPCHGSRYDLAGRVVRNVPAPLNLVIPPYHYADAERVVVGDSA